jgi:Glycosyltransferase family 87
MVTTSSSSSTESRRPPLWLAALAMAALWGAVYDLGRWTVLFVLNPIHLDFRIFYVAAQAGLQQGWSTIYDVGVLRALSTGFPPAERFVDSRSAFISPPAFAWILTPLTAMPLPAAYLVWTLVSLGALVLAWYLVAPYRGLAKASLLLLALAVWPVMESFYWGQPSLEVLGLVAVAWSLNQRGRPVAAGVALALAVALKPNIIVLVPLALLVSGRFRIFVAFAVASAVIGVGELAALGQSGIASWWTAIQYVQADAGHSFFTIARLFGRGPLTYAVEALLAALALFIAYRRRKDVDIVFAAGLVGSVASAFHLHQPDYSLLVLAAWLVLRTSPPVWHRVWLLSGVFTMQFITLGQPIPQLLWDVVWLVILATPPVSRRDSPRSPIPATSGMTSRSAQPAGRPALDDRMRSTDTSSV